MKLGITVLLAAITGTAACSHHQPPQDAHATPSTMPTQTALVAKAESNETQLAPGAPAIPGDPTAPPVAPPPKTADETPVTTKANLAAPGSSTLPAVPKDPAVDKTQTSSDEESVREIRALLAADKSLSAIARKITVIAQSGRIRLTGQVNTAEERAAVERAARKAANVIDVKNQLVVLE